MSTEGMDRRLHRYFDRDLPEEEREALSREIAGDDVLRRKLEALGDVSALVRGAAEQTLTEADSASMWASIARGAGLGTEGIARADGSLEGAPAEAKAGRPALRLVTRAGTGATGAAGPGAAAAPSEIAAPAPARRTIAEDPSTRRRRAFGIAIGGIALAAAALLAFMGPGDPPSEEPTASIDEPTAVEEILDPPDSMRTEVLAVDFGTNVGTIFAVEGSEGQRYAVVWLDDAVKIDEGAASPPDEEAPN